MGRLAALLARWYRCETGASAAEYALILSIVGATIAVGAIFLGNTVANSLTATGDRIANCGDGSC